jgi:hypothetical protein
MGMGIKIIETTGIRIIETTVEPHPQGTIKVTAKAPIGIGTMGTITSGTIKITAEGRLQGTKVRLQAGNLTMRRPMAGSRAAVCSSVRSGTARKKKPRQRRRGKVREISGLRRASLS